ncbi:hypothetical protein MMC10_003641 [Thelotrema lepadinum]|nr:hypothetical protein [Thelotrema lepadinum]
MDTSSIPLPPHPFYPPEINLAGYLANDWDVPTLIVLFFGGWAVISAATIYGVRAYNPRLSGWDQATLMWFVLCGSIHFFFEGYFALNHARMAGRQDFFGQLWKEYSMSDSRYLTSDPFVLCMETVTAFAWGPLSFLTALLIATDSAYRFPVQALVSTGQFYGDLLYYLTNLFNERHFGISYSRPEAYYFYGYYVFCNAFWIVIPACEPSLV